MHFVVLNVVKNKGNSIEKVILAVLSKHTNETLIVVLIILIMLIRSRNNN